MKESFRDLLFIVWMMVLSFALLAFSYWTGCQLAKAMGASNSAPLWFDAIIFGAAYLGFWALTVWGWRKRC